MKQSIIHKLFLTVISLLAFVAPNFSYAQSNNYPFKDGEYSKIILHYKCGFSADLAELDFKLKEVKDTPDPYFHVTLNARTYKGYDTFYKVRDFYESKFLTKDLSPLYFHRDVAEGKFWAKNWYDWKDDGKQLHAIVDKRNRPHRDTTFYAESVIRDIVNLFFDVRACDFKSLEMGNPYTSFLTVDKDFMKVVVRYIGRENKKISGYGTFKTIKLGIAIIPVTPFDNEDSDTFVKFDSGNAHNSQVKDSDFYGEDKLFIWLSDDMNKIPLYFQASLAIGSLNARVAKLEGLKYPLTSKIY